MARRSPILPATVAVEVYDLLCSIGGAAESSRDSFLMYAAESDGGPSEWRFQGHFGFGGKFRTRSSVPTQEKDWYVDYYPEDDTIERAGLAKILNDKLEALREKS